MSATPQMLTWHGPDGAVVRYPDWRTLPDPDTLATRQVVACRPSERLDQLASRVLGDPLQSWRLADGARLVDPDAVLELHQGRVRVPQPSFPTSGGR